MKLSEIRKISQKIPDTTANLNPGEMQQQLKLLGFAYENFYQELEMDSPYVDTHIDISHSNAHIQLHSHTFYEILCCHNTCGAEYIIGTERYKLQKGDIILVPPDISHRALLPEVVVEPYIRDVLWISPEFMQQVFRVSIDFSDSVHGKPAFFRTAGSSWEFLCELFHAGVRESEQRAPGWEAMVIGNTITILTHLYRFSKDIHTRPMRAEKPELIDQVLSYVETHLKDKITLSEIAHHFFVSESTITQTFRKKMGVSFYRCVTQRRLIAAKTLIERGIPLEDVAEQVGFSDYSSFFRAFKQEYGISPRQYRKMQN